MNRLSRPIGVIASSLILYAAWTLTANVHAQIPSKAQRAAIQACREDASKLCAGVKPGGGRLAICLQEKKASLSPACLTQIEKLEICGNDTNRPCQKSRNEAAMQHCEHGPHVEQSAACRAMAGG